MIQVLRIIINVLEIVFFIYLAFAALYIFIFAFASLFRYKVKNESFKINRNFAVLIPGYKEDAVIFDVAKDAVNQRYPRELFDIVIIADSFKQDTLDKLKELPIKLIEVSFEKSTKSKALNVAMEKIADDYDIALILDADNIMAFDFIEKINTAFNNGYIAVQGHRKAKNLNTSMAVLDAVSEEINNSIFRKGHRVLGLSSALIGSGMAFEYKFFKNMMSNVKAIGGFDKELELKLLKDKHKIEYIADAVVLDEKVQKTEVFATQRRRWLSAQFVYFRRYFFQGLYQFLFRGNIDFFDKVYQMLTPPRILLLGLISMITILAGILGFFGFKIQEIWLIFGFYHWLIVFGLVLLAFLFSVPIKFYNKQTLIALISLPKGFFLMFLSLLKIRGANKKFLHTDHSGDQKIEN